MTLAGFGTGPFGTMPFGTGLPTESPLGVLSVMARRENVVQVEFTIPPRFTQLADPNDGSDPRRYVVEPVSGTKGRDGEPTRPVSVIAVELFDDEGSIIDLILDRPMSPEPSQYTVLIQGLVSSIDGTLLPSTAFQFTGLYKGVIPLIPEFIFNNRDIANPQTRAGIFDPLPVSEGEDLDALLGTIPVDSQGDVAFDEGLAGYKKRVMRRLSTRKGRFTHLTNYGVSTIASVKQLSRAGLREYLAEEAEQQIRLEPETVDVSVAISVDPARPELARYIIRARTSFGQMPGFDVPINFASNGV